MGLCVCLHVCLIVGLFILVSVYLPDCLHLPNSFWVRRRCSSRRVWVSAVWFQTLLTKSCFFSICISKRILRTVQWFQEDSLSAPSEGDLQRPCHWPEPYCCISNVSMGICLGFCPPAPASGSLPKAWLSCIYPYKQNKYMKDIFQHWSSKVDIKGLFRTLHHRGADIPLLLDVYMVVTFRCQLAHVTSFLYCKHTHIRHLRCQLLWRGQNKPWTSKQTNNCIYNC